MVLRNKCSIAILLATYNGENFLREQLDTIFEQDMDDFTLYVRDDGSTDATLSILEDYRSRHENMLILDDDGRSLGPQMNFMELLRQVESDYYMFADQDDLWHKEKVQNALSKIRKMESAADGPSLVLTNMRLCDGDGRIMSESFWKSIHFDPTVFHDLRSYVFINYATGCTMMFNHHVKNVVFPVPDYSPMHDWWLTICTYRNGGKVGFIPEPQMDYRKHGDNVTGDFVATQKGKSVIARVKELLVLYRLAKKCHVVKTFADFLYHKYRINHLRATI